MGTIQIIPMLKSVALTTIWILMESMMSQVGARMNGLRLVLIKA
jgi:hypothetical protein